MAASPARVPVRPSTAELDTQAKEARAAVARLGRREFLDQLAALGQGVRRGPRQPGQLRLQGLRALRELHVLQGLRGVLPVHPLHRLRRVQQLHATASRARAASPRRTACSARPAPHSAYLVLSRNLSDCNYCFGCVGLSKKDFHILNVAFPRKEYFEITGCGRSSGCRRECAPFAVEDRFMARVRRVIASLLLVASGAAFGGDTGHHEAAGRHGRGAAHGGHVPPRIRGARRPAFRSCFAEGATVFHPAPPNVLRTDSTDSFERAWMGVFERIPPGLGENGAAVHDARAAGSPDSAAVGEDCAGVCLEPEPASAGEHARERQVGRGPGQGAPRGRLASMGRTRAPPMRPGLVRGVAGCNRVHASSEVACTLTGM